MSKTAIQHTFLSLPTEIRLLIASYAVEHLPDEKDSMHPGRDYNSLSPNSNYKPSENLAVRLVCRQFNSDFGRLAIQKTTFVLYHGIARKIDAQPDEKLKDVRKIAIPIHKIFHPLPEFFFNRECLHLDELYLYYTLETTPAHRKAMICFLRSLKNVKRVGFSTDYCFKDQRIAYCRLIGDMLKEDHYQRYDASNAPQPETTWWSWTYSDHSAIEFLTAQKPKPIMAERDYMLLMKPKVHELMEQMELVV